MLAALCWKSSGNCEDLKCWCGEEQECTWRTDIEQIFQLNLTEEFYVCTYGTKEENLEEYCHHPSDGAREERRDLGTGVCGDVHNSIRMDVE
jgi:hypothetical protein